MIFIPKQIFKMWNPSHPWRYLFFFKAPKESQMPPALKKKFRYGKRFKLSAILKEWFT